MTNELVKAFRQYQAMHHSEKSGTHLFSNLHEYQVRWLQIAAPELGLKEIDSLPAAIIEGMYSDVLRLGPNAALVHRFLNRLSLLTNLEDKRSASQQNTLDAFLSSPVAMNRSFVHKNLGEHSSSNRLLSINLITAADRSSLALKKYTSTALGVARAGALVSGFHEAEEHEQPMIKVYLPHLLDFIQSETETEREE